MIRDYKWSGEGNQPSSAFTTPRAGYMGSVDPIGVGCNFSLMPAFKIDPLPAPAIIYQIRNDGASKIVDEYQAMEANWDGYDANPISAAACGAARMFLSTFPRDLEAPDLTPNPSGTISMEWESPSGVAQLELGKTKYSFYLRKKGAKSVYHQGEARMAFSICAFLTALYAAPRPAAVSSIEYR